MRKLFAFFSFILLLSAFSLAQKFEQGVLYAKLKSNNLRSKSTVMNKIGVTDWGYVSQKATKRSKGSSPSKSGIEKLIKIHYSSDTAPLEACKLLMASGQFEFVEPNPIFSPLYVPNDPFASDGFSSVSDGQIQLFTHDFWKAWDIEKGDTNITIAIIDGGVNFAHEELQGNRQFNHSDPVDGINNDSNFYINENFPLIDDFMGWDIANWDNNPSSPDGFTHGTEVTGMAAATPNNGVGTAGTGFNTRYVHYKVSNDTTPFIYNFGYDGAIIAGESGADVINLSWGAQEAFITKSMLNTFELIINYLVLDLDIVVICAAGNTDREEKWFPAAFPNAISVTAVRFVDLKPLMSTFDYSVDINAAGVNTKVPLGKTTDDYINGAGTSLSAPVVSGAAALVRSRFPDLSALQVQNLLRVTGDLNDTISGNKDFQYKMGRKLNPYKALTEMPAAFRLINYDTTHFASEDGDIINISISLKNFLTQSSATSSARLINLNNDVVLIDSVLTIGEVATLTNTTPSGLFTFAVPAFTDTLTLDFIVEYTDTSMIDHEHIQLTIIADINTSASKDLINEIMTISPNPAKNRVSAKFLNQHSIEYYQLLTLSGQVVRSNQQPFLSNSIDLDLTGLEKGVYVFNIATREKTYSKKLIIN